jgi:hypothetical protein
MLDVDHSLGIPRQKSCELGKPGPRVGNAERQGRFPTHELIVQ